MADSSQDLGRLISTHGISPVYLQRAAFISALSFVFFLAMMLGFYIRESFGYFLLASAFLLLYLLTLFGWFIQKRTQLKIFENGITFKKDRISWDQIKKVTANGEIITGAKKITVPKSIQDYGIVLKTIKDHQSPAQ